MGFWLGMASTIFKIITRLPMPTLYLWSPNRYTSPGLWALRQPATGGAWHDEEERQLPASSWWRQEPRCGLQQHIKEQRVHSKTLHPYYYLLLLGYGRWCNTVTEGKVWCTNWCTLYRLIENNQRQTPCRKKWMVVGALQQHQCSAHKHVHVSHSSSAKQQSCTTRVLLCLSCNK